MGLLPNKNQHDFCEMKNGGSSGWDIEDLVCLLLDFHIAKKTSININAFRGFNRTKKSEIQLYIILIYKYICTMLK